MECSRATRVAHRTMVQLGYDVDELVEPTRSKAGRISGVKRGADGDAERASVRIECRDGGTRLQPIEGALVPSDWSFSRNFGYSFTTLAQRPDVEEPVRQVGLQVLLETLTPAAIQLDLGGPATTEEATLLRITVRNHTPRPVTLDAQRFALVASNGDPVTALDGDALARVMTAGAAAAEVRGRLLRTTNVSARQTVIRYLVFPADDYRDAHVAITDAETGETEGFVVQVQ